MSSKKKMEFRCCTLLYEFCMTENLFHLKEKKVFQLKNAVKVSQEL